jgi:signal transduction histidine kinase
VTVAVSDDGPGIPPEESAHIFDRFYRVDKSRSGDRDGGGLGLAITRGIVEAHGGRVGVQSTVGEGSTFTLSLPARNGTRTPRNEAFNGP